VLRGLLAYRRGRISQAVTDERQAISILEGEHNAVARAYATAFLAHALIDSGDLELAADQLDALPLTDPAQPTATPLRESGWLSAVYSPTGSFVVLASPGTTSEETRGCGREPNARPGSRRLGCASLWLVGQRCNVSQFGGGSLQPIRYL
jgi:hypothetical protein